MRSEATRWEYNNYLRNSSEPVAQSKRSRTFRRYVIILTHKQQFSCDSLRSSQFSDAWKAIKLNSVGGDVLALALNSSSLVSRSGGEGKAEEMEVGEEEEEVETKRRPPKRGISRGSIFERFPSMATPSNKKQQRWAQKEKNVSYLPAYYLKKLVRRLPAPLGLAEVVDEEVRRRGAKRR